MIVMPILSDEASEFTRISSEAGAFTVTEENCSCTGPTILKIVFKREFLHELEVGPETVTVVLAKEVE